jgi:hypothetical protein
LLGLSQTRSQNGFRAKKTFEKNQKKGLTIIKILWYLFQREGEKGRGSKKKGGIKMAARRREEGDWREDKILKAQARYLRYLVGGDPNSKDNYAYTEVEKEFYRVRGIRCDDRYSPYEELTKGQASEFIAGRRALLGV